MFFLVGERPGWMEQTARNWMRVDWSAAATCSWKHVLLNPGVQPQCFLGILV